MRYQKNAEIGVGKYLEARSFYAADEFVNDSLDGHEKRTIHLGIDICVPAGTVIYAPIKGVVHQIQDNKSELDYGPTVILKHQLEEEEKE